MMKHLTAVLFTVIAVIVAEEFKMHDVAGVLTLINECLEEWNISDEYRDKFRSFEVLDDENAHCYVKCVVEKLQLFDERHGLLVHNIVAQLNDSTGETPITPADIQPCADKNEQRSDACQWAFRGFKCLYDKHLAKLKY